MDRHDSPRSFGFFLVPRFAMLAFTSAVEPLRAANLLTERELYRWCAISRDGGPVPASNGLEVVFGGRVGRIVGGLGGPIPR